MSENHDKTRSTRRADWPQRLGGAAIVLWVATISFAGAEDVAPADQSVFSPMQLDGADLPEWERSRFDPPPEVVAVLGDSRMRTAPCFRGEIRCQIVVPPQGDYFFVTSPEFEQNEQFALDTLEHFEAPPITSLGSATSIAFSADGTTLIAGSGLWRVDPTTPNRPKFKRAGLSRWGDRRVPCCTITPDGKRAILANAKPGDLELWDISSDLPQRIKTIGLSADGRPTQLAFSADGKRLLAVVQVQNKQTVFGWDVDGAAGFAPRELAIPSVESKPDSHPFAFSRDGRRVFVAYGEAAGVWDIESVPARRIQEFESKPDEHPAIAVSPSGDTLAMRIDGAVTLWKSLLGENSFSQVVELPRPLENESRKGKSPRSTTRNSPSALAFAAEGRQLIVAGGKGDLHVWDLTQDPPVERLPAALGAPIDNGVFSADGKRLVTSGAAGIGIWDLEGKKPTLKDAGGLGVAPIYERPPFLFDRGRLLGHYGDLYDLSAEPIEQAPLGVGLGSMLGFSESEDALLFWDFRRNFEWVSWKRGDDGKVALAPRGHRKVELPEECPITHDVNDDPNLSRHGRFVVRQRDGDLAVYSLSDPTHPIVVNDIGQDSDWRLSPSGKRLLLAHKYGQSRGGVYDLDSLDTAMHSVSVGKPSIFLVDERLLLTATVTHGREYIPGRHTLVLMDWRQNRELWRLSMPMTIKGLIAHPDGRHVAVVNSNSTVYLIRLPNFAEPPPRPAPLLPLPKDQIVIPQFERKQIPTLGGQEWPPDLVAIAGNLRGRTAGAVRAIHFHPSGKILMTSSFGTSEVWRTDELDRPIARWTDGSGRFTRDGKRVLGARRYDLDLAAPNGPAFKPGRLWDEDEPKTLVGLHPATRWGLTAELSSLKVWDFRGAKPKNVATIPIEDATKLGDCQFSADGKRLLTISITPPRADVWDCDWKADDGPRFTRLGAGIASPHCLLSHDGNQVFVPEPPQFDLVAGRTVGPTLRRITLDQIKTAAKPISVVVWPVVVSASMDGTRALVAPAIQNPGYCVVFDLTAKQPEVVRHYHGAMWNVTAMAFSPDGKTIATGDALGRLRLIDSTVDPPDRMSDEESADLVQSASFSPNGKLLATSANAAGGQLWTLDGPAPRATASFHFGTEAPPIFLGAGVFAIPSTDLETHVVSPFDGASTFVFTGAKCAASGDGASIIVPTAGGTALLFYGWEMSSRGSLRVASRPWRSVPMKSAPDRLSPSWVRFLLSHRGERDFFVQGDDDAEGVFQVFDMDAPETPLAKIEAGKGAGVVALSPSGRLLWTAKPGALWDLSNTPAQSVPAPTPVIWGWQGRSAFLHDEQWLAFTDGSNLIVHNGLENRELYRAELPFRAHSVIAHPDGRHVGVITENGLCLVFRLPE